VQNVTAVIDNELPTISISAPTTTAGGTSTMHQLRIRLPPSSSC
jgi:hypothetical protein